jgi:hypothetical protein
MPDGALSPQVATEAAAATSIAAAIARPAAKPMTHPSTPASRRPGAETERGTSETRARVAQSAVSIATRLPPTHSSRLSTVSW